MTDVRRGRLLVLEERESGLLRVAPERDPDMDYWIARGNLRLRPEPGARARKRAARFVEDGEERPFWFSQLLEHGRLFARVYPRFTARFEELYRGLTGLGVDGSTPGVHYDGPHMHWCISAGVFFALELDLEGLPPGLHKGLCRGAGDRKACHKISCVRLFWELVGAGARLGAGRVGGER